MSTPYARKDARVRLVLDTNVVLSGLLWRSHPRRLLDLAKEDAVSLYTSSALLDELADVLAREKWTAMLAIRQTHATYLMQRYGVLAKVVRPKRIGRVVPNDPDDDAVIACALAARADLIVSTAMRIQFEPEASLISRSNLFVARDATTRTDMLELPAVVTHS
ncbi:MAG: putative toxin-antitoxin system toxin component, PIN family [Sulfuritalea sp.]|nr:putative toxin-antitoxin system toxin component, PIN family [Sulfuritalea sp.]